MTSSSVAELLARQGNASVTNWTLRANQRRAGVRKQGFPTVAGITVADAETPSDLTRLARYVIQHDLLHAVAGSAGLAGSLADRLGSRRKTPPLPQPGARHVLVVMGSPHPMAIRQLEFTRDALSLPVHRIGSGGHGDVGVLRRLAADIEAQRVALLAAPVLGSTEAAGEPASVAAALAKLTAQLVEQRCVDGLVLAGGDIAAAVCERLGVDRIELAGQLFPGAPLGRVHGGNAGDFWLVIKSGAHGDERALLIVLDALRRLPRAVSASINVPS